MRYPFDLWGQRGSYRQEVAGESNYLDAIRAIVGGHTEWTEVTTQALLVPEPTNRYDRNAVQVVIDGNVVGYLPREDAARYVPLLTHLVNHDWVGRTAAQVGGGLFDDDFDEDDDLRGFRQSTARRFSGTVRLDLAEPHMLMPANQPPSEAHVMLPSGRAIQVTGEEDHLDTLAPLIPQAGETWIYATLHEMTGRKALVEVRVNGSAAGRLTPGMSGELLPAIRHFAETGRATAGRAILKGNRLKADVALYVARAGELPPDLLSSP